MPRERVTRIMVYTFDELSESAKDKALDHLYYINVDYEWWDNTYYDSENVGISIEAFDIDRGSYCQISFMGSAEETAGKIIEQHGEMCDTYKTARAYLDERNKIVDEWPKDEDGEFEDEYELEGKLDDLDDEFKKDISEDYLSILRREYDYLTSREAIIESIEAGDYEFDKEGNII